MRIKRKRGADPSVVVVVVVDVVVMSLMPNYMNNLMHIYGINNNKFVGRIGIYLFLLWLWNHPTKPH